MKVLGITPGIDKGTDMGYPYVSFDGSNDGKLDGSPYRITLVK